jgi:hypothetical protein
VIIDLLPHDFLACKEFADRQLEQSFYLYRDRGEPRYLKQQEDIITGKLGELAAFKYLKHRCIKTNYPDFKIYNPKEKSFECDLKSEDTNYHVKTQPERSVKRYGYSWLVQAKDPLVNNPDEKDYLILVAQHDILRYEVLMVVHASEVPWAEPKVYKKTKKAIYLKDFSERTKISNK